MAASWCASSVAAPSSVLVNIIGTGGLSKVSLVSCVHFCSGLPGLHIGLQRRARLGASPALGKNAVATVGK
jgi:hypothetical protein